MNIFDRIQQKKEEYLQKREDKEKIRTVELSEQREKMERRAAVHSMMKEEESKVRDLRYGKIKGFLGSLKETGQKMRENQRRHESFGGQAKRKKSVWE